MRKRPVITKGMDPAILPFIYWKFRRLSSGIRHGMLRYIMAHEMGGYAAYDPDTCTIDIKGTAYDTPSRALRELDTLRRMRDML